MNPDAYLAARVESALEIIDEPGRGKVPAADLQTWRLMATRDDPLLFAIVYLGHHLASDATGNEISLSEAHVAWCERARGWRLGPPAFMADDRHAEIAPRETGKSTWWFLLIALWAAAHGHKKFIAAFADTATQAEGHLDSFRKELEGNALLREDFPTLVAPKLRGNRRQAVADNRGMIQSASGFVFAARGIDSGALGLKVGKLRPDLLLMDDVEPGEAKYSDDLIKKRLSTLIDVVLPLNSFASVVIVGTVTMPGSIMHQLVKSARGILEAAESEWIRDEQIVAHHYPAIVVDDAGNEHSIWPHRWSIEYLQSIRHTRAYAKNYANDPKGNDGDFWTMDDFIKVDSLRGVARVLLEVDPAVTTKKKSDYTGLAVLGWSPIEKKVIVLKAIAVKLSPAHLRIRILTILNEFEERDLPIGLVRVETNQGGELWPHLFHDLPVPVKTMTNNVAKEIRAADVLGEYQRGRIVHVPGLDAVEEQMVTFPKAPNDDLVDAVGDGAMYFINAARKAHKKRKVRTSASYI